MTHETMMIQHNYKQR